MEVLALGLQQAQDYTLNVSDPWLLLTQKAT